MKKPSKTTSGKSGSAKLPPIRKTVVKPTHATRAQIRRAVRAVIAARGKANA